jgi:L-lactate dehydrogenase (cytochrome)
MVMSGSSLIRLEEGRRRKSRCVVPGYLPGEPARIEALIDRVAAAGLSHARGDGGRRRCCRAARTTCGADSRRRCGPSLRLAWDGITHPRWLFGTALRTLRVHGMPHFRELVQGARGADPARNVERDFTKRDHLDWKHLEQIRAQWKGRSW